MKLFVAVLLLLAVSCSTGLRSCRGYSHGARYGYEGDRVHTVNFRYGPAVPVGEQAIRTIKFVYQQPGSQPIDAILQQNGGGRDHGAQEVEIIELLRHQPHFKTNNAINHQPSGEPRKTAHNPSADLKVKTLRVQEKVIDANGYSVGNDIVHNVQVIHKGPAGQGRNSGASYGSDGGLGMGGFPVGCYGSNAGARPNAFSDESYSSKAAVDQSIFSGGSYGANADSNQDAFSGGGYGSNAGVHQSGISFSSYSSNAGVGHGGFPVANYGSNTGAGFGKSLESLDSLKIIGALAFRHGFPPGSSGQSF